MKYHIHGSGHWKFWKCINLTKNYSLDWFFTIWKNFVREKVLDLWEIYQFWAQNLSSNKSVYDLIKAHFELARMNKAMMTGLLSSKHFKGNLGRLSSFDNDMGITLWYLAYYENSVWSLTNVSVSSASFRSI